jgi:hypothetical protein
MSPMSAARLCIDGIDGAVMITTRLKDRPSHAAIHCNRVKSYSDMCTDRTHFERLDEIVPPE